MDAGDIGALVAVLISTIAIVQSRKANSIATRSSTAADRSATAAERAAEASERQTEIQDALSRRTAEPSLWVDIRPDDQQSEALILLVGNSGPTVATDVVVTFDPALRQTPMPADGARHGEERLNRGLSSLPPGRTLTWSLGPAGTLYQLNANAPLSYTVTINAKGPFGPLEPLTYTIDLQDFTSSWKNPTGTLHGVTTAVQDLQKNVEVIAKSLPSPDRRS